jgi:hypothetical protein
MAWAGFVEPDDTPIDPDYPFRGTADRLLFQVGGATCTGTFVDVTSTHYPVQEDMTRDIDVLDVNGDGRLDLYVSNARFAPGAPLAEGADFNDRVLINVDCGLGFGCFVDETGTRLPPPPASDPHNSTVCDVDGLNGPDIVSATQIGPNRLLINNGVGVFTDETDARGVAGPPGDQSHDVACVDYTGPAGVGAPDGYPELIFARRHGQRQMFLANDGAGNFTDQTAALLPDVLDSTSTVAVCDLDGDGIAELPLGNGDVNSLFAQTNRVLRFVGGVFVDDDVNLGFNFSKVSGVAANLPDGGVTEEVTCADLDGDGALNVVAWGNAGSLGTWLFFRPWPVACGDEFCDPAETPCGCPGDCAAVCGDGCCTGGETSTNCNAANGGDCPSVCGDGACTAGETDCPGSCPADCDPACGDGCCTGGETTASCGVDCCGADGVCDPGENPCDCPADNCPVVCGDGCCSTSAPPGICCGPPFCAESCCTCDLDCPGC